MGNASSASQALRFTGELTEHALPNTIIVLV